MSDPKPNPAIVPVGDHDWHPVPWYDTHEKQDLGRWLASEGMLVTADDAFDFDEQPWKWGEEYDAWKAELRNERAEAA